ncbi:hypothetical protein [Ideonella azotifigens]|uniref:Uncharacterized protein n=1 Tax=Ideonella azotifigens TaxID=513160 RepID=A0ABP3UTE0_9BURK|nr:hypothetical protein [Ideonella azotifigens]
MTPMASLLCARAGTGSPQVSASRLEAGLRVLVETLRGAPPMA